MTHETVQNVNFDNGFTCITGTIKDDNGDVVQEWNGNTWENTEGDFEDVSFL